MVLVYLPTYLWVIYGVNVGSHIPAPWFAYGYINAIFSHMKSCYRLPRVSTDGPSVFQNEASGRLAKAKARAGASQCEPTPMKSSSMVIIGIWFIYSYICPNYYHRLWYLSLVYQSFIIHIPIQYMPCYGIYLWYWNMNDDYIYIYIDLCFDLYYEKQQNSIVVEFFFRIFPSSRVPNSFLGHPWQVGFACFRSLLGAHRWPATEVPILGPGLRFKTLSRVQGGAPVR